MIVPGDAVATAGNIATHETLWRMGIAIDLIMHLCDVPLMLVFYVLLKPVNRNLALLLIIFNLIQTAMLITNKLNLVAALFAVNAAVHLKTRSAEQLYNMAYISIKLHNYGFSVGD